MSIFLDSDVSQAFINKHKTVTKLAVNWCVKKYCVEFVKNKKQQTLFIMIDRLLHWYMTDSNSWRYESFLWNICCWCCRETAWWKCALILYKNTLHRLAQGSLTSGVPAIMGTTHIISTNTKSGGRKKIFTVHKFSPWRFFNGMTTGISFQIK